MAMVFFKEGPVVFLDAKELVLSESLLKEYQKVFSNWRPTNNLIEL